MSDQQSETRRNRGKDPHDEALFGRPKELEKLLQALQDMHYLLNKDYPPRATLALVGNRYRLRQRQILALQGMACSAKDIQNRKNKEVAATGIRNKTVYVDGFNIVIILESLLSGGYVFKGLDGCYRDISSVHGSYKRVRQTEEVLIMLGKALHELGAERVNWIFDAPVSNSGRLKTLCYEIAAQQGFLWDVYLDNAPDKFLIAENRLIVSSDAWVLNGCYAWFNLASYIINHFIDSNVTVNIINQEGG
ncbi:DUF434 domain-containing protein [Mucilaginibacter ginsenosidivorax]|uniref:DUF434 domain-containing protein n=1 Tax=Mucilaginibacter ginsenosidivorax TaxID=862126 RepID=A0A5B8W3Q1_9SPHI|nr:DUF434 domain-containing protein [Mucilaginibacter ginsenosidivorax]QEC78421.1 DUF434 domain-containing protein [Mucilaginibacter ginsenosidivorax]